MAVCLAGQVSKRALLAKGETYMPYLPQHICLLQFPAMSIGAQATSTLVKVHDLANNLSLLCVISQKNFCLRALSDATV